MYIIKMIILILMNSMVFEVVNDNDNSQNKFNIQ